MAPQRRLVTVPSFTDAGCVRLSPVPYRGFVHRPLHGQSAGPVFNPCAGERHAGSSPSVSTARPGVPREAWMLPLRPGMRPTVGPARPGVKPGTWGL